MPTWLRWTKEPGAGDEIIDEFTRRGRDGRGLSLSTGLVYAFVPSGTIRQQTTRRWQAKVVRTFRTAYKIHNLGIESGSFVVIVEAKTKHPTLQANFTSPHHSNAGKLFLRCQGRCERTTCSRLAVEIMNQSKNLLVDPSDIQAFQAHVTSILLYLY
jgi:hypothetical protein